MSHTSEGSAWQVYAVMDKNGRVTRLVAKDPARPAVTDILDDVRDLLDRTSRTDAANQPTQRKTGP